MSNIKAKNNAIVEAITFENNDSFTNRMYFSSIKKALNHYNDGRKIIVQAVNQDGSIELNKLSKNHYMLRGWSANHHFTKVSIYTVPIL